MSFARDAVLKAADHIERHPEEYYFFRHDVPSGPGHGEMACLLGWMGHFAGMPAEYWAQSSHNPIDKVAVRLGFGSEIEFYNRMNKYGPAGGFSRFSVRGWAYDSDIAAKTLRRLAEEV